MDTNVKDFKGFTAQMKALFEQALRISGSIDDESDRSAKDYLASDVEENLFHLFTADDEHRVNMELWEYKELMVDLITLVTNPDVMAFLPQPKDNVGRRLKNLYHFFDALDNKITIAYMDYLLLTRFYTSKELSHEDLAAVIARYTFESRDEIQDNFFNKSMSEAHKDAEQLQRYLNLKLKN